MKTTKVAKLTVKPMTKKGTEAPTTKPRAHQEGLERRHPYLIKRDRLFNAILNLADNCDLNDMEIVRCFFRAGCLFIDPEWCDQCVADLFEESRMFAEERLQDEDEEVAAADEQN